MTTARYDPKEFRMQFTGHAKAGAPVDPVCAGVSALAWTLAEAATDRADYRASLLIEPNGAKIDIRCDPQNGAWKDCRYMFEIILGGLAVIAEAHPDNLKIEIGG